MKGGSRLSRATFPKPSEGARLISPHFSLTWGRSPLSEGCAVVISKKTAKRSVDRHLLKRRVLGVVRPWLRKGHFFVIYARSGSPALPFKSLQEEITALLMKTKLSVAQ